MPTLILSPRFTVDSQALWRAAVARRWGVHRLTTWRIADDARGSHEPFLYVEALFGPTLADDLGVELLGPAEDFMPQLPERYRARAIRLSTLAEAKSLDRPAFVKPPNDKSFPAKVYLPGELSDAFEPLMPVLISKPVRFANEYRCFVLDRQIRTLSLYARDGVVAHPGPSAGAEVDALLLFVNGLLQDRTVDLPRACALDCGLIPGRAWAVVEVNAAWGAGIYFCNPDRAIDVVRAATVKK